MGHPFNMMRYPALLRALSGSDLFSFPCSPRQSPHQIELQALMLLNLHRLCCRRDSLWGLATTGKTSSRDLCLNWATTCFLATKAHWSYVQKADSLVIPRHCVHKPTIMCQKHETFSRMHDERLNCLSHQAVIPGVNCSTPPVLSKVDAAVAIQIWHSAFMVSTHGFYLDAGSLLARQTCLPDSLHHRCPDGLQTGLWMVPRSPEPFDDDVLYR